MTTITEHLGAAYLVESTGGERLDVFGPVIDSGTSRLLVLEKRFTFCEVGVGNVILDM